MSALQLKGGTARHGESSDKGRCKVTQRSPLAASPTLD